MVLELKSHKYKFDILIFILITVITFGIGYTIKTDFYLHSNHVVHINEGVKNYPVNFLYYLIINVLTGFTINYSLVYNTTLAVVSLALFGKYYLTKKYLFKDSCYSHRVDILVTLSCFFYFTIPDPLGVGNQTLYLGRFVPNIFHNTTFILSMPFVLLLFFKQIEIIKNNYLASTKDWMLIFGLIVMNIYLKPSYLFAFIPTSGLFLILLRRKDSLGSLIKKMSVYILGVALILISSIVVYKYGVGNYNKEKSTIVFSLFANHKAYYPYWYFPIVLLFSFSFPILFLFFNRKTVLKNSELMFALISLIIGLLLGFVVSEIGPRKGDGNFLWQIISCYYLLLIVMVKNSLVKYKNKKMEGLEFKVLIGAFILHVLSGVFYLVNLFYWGNI